MRSVFVLLLALLAIASSQPAEPRPNIVIFLADDHGYLDSEVYGSHYVRTPSMRRLAREGMTFTHAFVASPSCAPSRAALLTGLMPARNGSQANHSKPRAELKKWPAYFKELGYETAAFGKVSHYKHTADYGFDHFAHDTFHDHAAIPAALKWLRERKSDKPLCLFVGSNWPHVPWPANANTIPTADALPARHVATPETFRARAAYFVAVEKMDAELGRVYAAAQDKFGTNLLFLHTSDHGAQFPFGKWNCYDAGIRTSLLVTWPGRIKPQSATAAMVSWIDILPTLLEAAGAKPPQNIDGQSFLKVLSNPSAAHREVIFATHTADGEMNKYPIRALRTADWKYIRNLQPDARHTTHIDRAHKNEASPAAWGVYWDTWVAAAQTNSAAAAVVSAYHQRPAEELFDLDADPNEERNVATDPRHADRLKQFRAQLTEWMRAQNDH